MVDIGGGGGAGANRKGAGSEGGGAEAEGRIPVEARIEPFRGCIASYPKLIIGWRHALR